MPVGLGMLVARDYLQDPESLMCPAMAGKTSTWYGSTEYEYDSGVWKALNRRAGFRWEENGMLTLEDWID